MILANWTKDNENGKSITTSKVLKVPELIDMLKYCIDKLDINSVQLDDVIYDEWDAAKDLAESLTNMTREARETGYLVSWGYGFNLRVWEKKVFRKNKLLSDHVLYDVNGQLDGMMDERIGDSDILITSRPRRTHHIIQCSIYPSIYKDLYLVSENETLVTQDEDLVVLNNFLSRVIEVTEGKISISSDTKVYSALCRNIDSKSSFYGWNRSE